jgi:hypothetical protein
VYAGTLISVSGKCEIKGSGAAGTAPEIAPLLRGAAWSETVVGGTSVTYKPTSTQAEPQVAVAVLLRRRPAAQAHRRARQGVSFDLQVGKAAMGCRSTSPATS